MRRGIFASLILCGILLAGCNATVQQTPAPVLQFTEPKMVGDALPSPTIPLRNISGLIGPIPIADAATVDLFTRNFEALAFHFEDGSDWPWVTKWNTFVSIQGDYAADLKVSSRQQGGLSDDVKTAASQSAQLLQQITGVPIAVRRGPAPVFIDQDTPEKKMFAEDYYCFVTVHNRHDGSMDMAFIHIGEKIKGRLLASCIMEELSQMMGPANDTDLVEVSLWRPATRDVLITGRKYDWLTWHDAIILRVLYNERIKPGMHKDDAMPIVRELIAKELRDLNAG